MGELEDESLDVWLEADVGFPFSLPDISTFFVVQRLEDPTDDTYLHAYE